MRLRVFRSGAVRWAALGVVLASAALPGEAVRAQTPGATETAPQGPLRQGRELLMAKQFAAAKKVFSDYLQAHPGGGPGAVQAQLGLGDAQLGLHEYEAAEMTYRAVTALQPQMWQAHKNLVVVEAALGRWEEFDRERTVLRMARERGAPGISARESDVIDSFDVHGEHWVVRAYFEPLGRSKARYNFEHFGPDGRAQTYVSLEDAAAAQAALSPGDIHVGLKEQRDAANSQPGSLALNWYTGTAHGTIRSYPLGEPTYERLRADVRHWVAAHPEITGTGPVHGARSSQR